LGLACAACGQRGDLLGTIIGPVDSGASESGATPSPSYFIGADLTFVEADEAAGATYSDGAPKDILQLLKDHGFNTVRLRRRAGSRAEKHRPGARSC
jgi:hypothetical protein